MEHSKADFSSELCEEAGIALFSLHISGEKPALIIPQTKRTRPKQSQEVGIVIMARWLLYGIVSILYISEQGTLRQAGKKALACARLLLANHA